MPKRKMSAEARKRISEAQKKRWADKKKSKEIKEFVPYVPLVASPSPSLSSSRYRVIRSISQYTKGLSSALEGYIEGFLDGYNEPKE